MARLIQALPQSHGGLVIGLAEGDGSDLLTPDNFHKKRSPFCYLAALWIGGVADRVRTIGHRTDDECREFRRRKSVISSAGGSAPHAARCAA